MHNLVLQSDFGLDDGAVSAMYGVAYGVEPDLKISDLTHNIPPYNIWEASYRLAQTIDYWPVGTVFVSVVDPGVGSKRLSIVARTRTGHYIITPDNGTLTHVAAIFGLDEVREIDEKVNRRPGSETSYTFHGRDIYAFTGARLAAGVIDFEGVGRSIDPASIVRLEVEEPWASHDDIITGTVDAHDVRYGSLWTSIPRALFLAHGGDFGKRYRVRVVHDGQVVHSNQVEYVPSFAAVDVGESLLYVNSLDRMAVAINRGSYARAFNIGEGPSWRITLAPSS